MIPWDFWSQMVLQVKKSGRPNRIDLARLAELLGVTPGHLSMFLAGKRFSQSLMNRLVKLMSNETKKATRRTRGPKKKVGKYD